MENLGKSEDRDNAQEVFLDKMEKTVPWIYKDLLSVPVSEFAFHSRGQVAYFDSFLKIACLEDKDVLSTIEKFQKISEVQGVDFIISISLDAEEIPASLKENIIVAL